MKENKQKQPRRKSVPKNRSNKYNNEQLKAEYLAGDHQTVTAFFKEKGIPEGTYSKWTIGWAEERVAFQARAAQLALKRIAEKKAKLIANNIKAGELLIGCGVQGMMRNKDSMDASQSITATKAGAEIVEKMLRLEQDTEKPDLELGVAVQTQGVNGESLRVIAKAIARSNAGVRETELPSLGFKECGAG